MRKETVNSTRWQASQFALDRPGVQGGLGMTDRMTDLRVEESVRLASNGPGAWGIFCVVGQPPPAFLVILRKSGPRQGRGSRRRRAFSCFVPLLLSSYLGTWEHLPSRCPSPLSAKGVDWPCFSYPGEEALRLPTFCSSLFICSFFFHLFICSFIRSFVRSFLFLWSGFIR